MEKKVDKNCIGLTVLVTDLRAEGVSSKHGKSDQKYDICSFHVRFFCILLLSEMCNVVRGPG